MKLNLTGEEIGKVVFNGVCYLVYCDENSNIKKNTVECETTLPTESTTTPEDTTPEGTTPEGTTPEGTTPSSTTPFEDTTVVTSTPQCVYKNFVYKPGS